MAPFKGGSLIWESFSSDPLVFDLDQTNLIFQPEGANGYKVSSPVDLAVTSGRSPAESVVGAKAHYTATVTNSGTKPLHSVSLVDTLPASGRLTAVTTSRGTCKKGRNSPTCKIGTLAPGAKAQLKFTIRVTAPGKAVNRVDVSTTTRGDFHYNNTSAATVNVHL